MWVRTAAIVLLTAACCVSCSQAPAVDARRFQITGVVSGHEASPPRVVLAHEAIKGFMPAMSMAFEVREDGVPLKTGDRIVATLVVTDSRTWLENVKVTGNAGVVVPAVTARGSATEGTNVPAFPMVDQNGRSITLRDFTGRVLVVTFIYSRCPLPEFCPLMVKHLEALRRRAADEGFLDRIALLGVTLDPEFDTPTVLQSYGRSMLAGDDRFDRWTLATGSARQVEDVATFFGVGYRLESAGFITHTLATAVVNVDGRIVRVLPSNSWRVGELIDVVKSRARSGTGATN